MAAVVAEVREKVKVIKGKLLRTAEVQDQVLLLMARDLESLDF